MSAKYFLVFMFIFLFVSFLNSAVAKTLFYDDFANGVIDKVYGFSAKEFPQTKPVNQSGWKRAGSSHKPA